MGAQPYSGNTVNGNWLCVKGWTCHELVYSPERLRKPLIRRGGRLVEVNWNKALKYVAENLKRIINRNGVDSFGMITSSKITNEECYLSQKLARILGTNNVDECARLCHSPSVYALSRTQGVTAMSNSIPDISESDCIFVIGSNTTEEHPIVAGKILEAKLKDAKLIVADPRRIHLAEFADVYLRHRPGTDTALLNGMSKVIVSEGLVNRKFVKENTRGFRKYVKWLEKIDLNDVSRDTQVDVEDIRKAAKMYAAAKRGSIFWGVGVTQHLNGVDNVYAIINLALLTGHLGRPGTGLNSLRGQNNVQGASDMGCTPTYLPGYRSIEDREARVKIQSIWGAPLPTGKGLRLVEQIEAAAAGKIKALYVIGANPALSAPDSSFVKRALNKLEFLIVQDVFLDETAMLADVVLPASIWVEKTGTFTNTERRVQLSHAVLKPLPESLPDWKIICLIASELELKRFFNYNGPKQIFEEIRKVVPQYFGITYERLMEPPGIQWPCPTIKHPGTKILIQPRKLRGTLNPVDYIDVAEKLDAKYPFTLLTGRLFVHYHTGTMTRKTSILSREVETGFVEMNVRDAEKLGIRGGQMVKVKTRRGAVRLEAKLSERVNEGLIFIPFHFAECPANRLTSRRTDKRTGMPELKISAANIER